MPFAVKFRRRDIFEYKTPRSGISYTSAALEYINAAHWDQQSYEEFCMLEPDDQAVIVAAYRVSMQMEAVIAVEQARQARSIARRRRGAG